MRILLDGRKDRPRSAPAFLAPPRRRARSDRPERPRRAAELAPHNHLSQLNVLRQLDHLRTYPVVAGAARSRDGSAARLVVRHRGRRGARYDEAAKRFVVIDEAEADRILARLNDR